MPLLPVTGFYIWGTLAHNGLNENLFYPKNVNKTNFGCLKLSHCNFEAIAL